MCDAASDAGSETSLVMKLKGMRKKKPKVQPADFDELFARGLALSAQLESEQNKDPFGPKAVDLGRQMMEVGAATAAAGGDTGAISDALTQGVSGVTGVKIGYEEKVNAYLDDQAQASGATLNMGEAPRERERGRRRHRKEPKTSTSESVGDESVQKEAEEKRKTSREYTKPEDIQLSPVPKRDLFTGEMLAPGSPDALFLAKVTAFVADNEKDAHWPARPPSTNAQTVTRSAPTQVQAAPRTAPVIIAPPAPAHPEPVGGVSSSLPIPSQPRPAPSPGRSFLDSKSGYEVFGPSVERDIPAAVSAPDTGDVSTTTTTTIAPHREHIPPSPSPISMETFSAAAKDAVIKLTSPPPPPPSSTTTGPPPRMTVIATSPPGQDEPADKGIPTRLVPDKLMANEEFYESLRTNLKTALTPERCFEMTQEDPGQYQKYSHHLGRAEFGTLKKPSLSRDDSGERRQLVSRTDSRRISRQNSGTNLSRVERSDSRMSDYSVALPDLEIDPSVVMKMESEVVAPPVLRTMSDNVNDPPPVPHPSVASQDVMVKKEEVLKDMEQHKQKIQEAKAWIQNGLMTVVGVGVMAYLQTLEQMGGAS